MSSRIINQVGFLRTSREFPEEIHQLSIEINRSYVDIANTVNARTIAIFAVNRPAQTGESWYFSSTRNQGLRQVYEFGAILAGATLNISYSISGFNRLIRLFGAVKTATDERPIPFVSATDPTGNIEVRLNTSANQIVIVNGATAPAIVSGQIVFEWLSQV